METIRPTKKELRALEAFEREIQEQGEWHARVENIRRLSDAQKIAVLAALPALAALTSMFAIGWKLFKKRPAEKTDDIVSEGKRLGLL